MLGNPAEEMVAQMVKKWVQEKAGGWVEVKVLWKEKR
jgi:hypothetical protein